MFLSYLTDAEDRPGLFRGAAQFLLLLLGITAVN